MAVTHTCVSLHYIYACRRDASAAAALSPSLLHFCHCFSIIFLCRLSRCYNYQGSSLDIYFNSGSLTCTAGCNDAGMYMPGGSCSNPVAADIYHSNDGTCYSYCASTSSDCSVCPTGTYRLIACWNSEAPTAEPVTRSASYEPSAGASR